MLFRIVSYRLRLFASFLWLIVPFACFGQIPQFDISLEPEDYQTLVNRDMFSNDYLHAALRYEGRTWREVEFRYKGRSNRYYAKKSYRIKLPKDDLLDGMRDINLHSMYSDRSMVREKLAWDLFAAIGETAPTASYARLTINGHPQGLYVRVDKVDKYFLKGTGKKATSLYSTNSYYSLSDLTIQPPALLKVYYPKEIGDTTKYLELKDLLDAINLTPDSLLPGRLSEVFDMQSVYDWFAGNALMMMGDSYTKNYFLARDSTKQHQQWTIIPWDYDQSFGICSDPSRPYPDNLLDDAFAYSFPPLTGMDNILKVRLWHSPALREMFRRHLDTLLQTTFTNEWMDRRIDSLAGIARPEAMRDSLKRGSMQDFGDGIEAVKYFVSARRNFLLHTFINAPEQDENLATLAIGQMTGPVTFVERDGRQIATVWIESASHLDSLTVLVYGDSIPPHLATADTGRCVRRLVQLIPDPPSAKFKAKLQFEYEDFGSQQREVGTAVQNERELQPFAFVGKKVIPLSGQINPASNTVTIDSIDQKLCGSNSYFYLAVP